MKTFYITVQNTSGTPYDFEVEASSPEDVIKQVLAFNVGMKMARVASLESKVDFFDLVDLSTSKTRKHEYIRLSDWVIP